MAKKKNKTRWEYASVIFDVFKDDLIKSTLTGAGYLDTKPLGNIVDVNSVIIKSENFVEEDYGFFRNFVRDALKLPSNWIRCSISRQLNEDDDYSLHENSLCIRSHIIDQILDDSCFEINLVLKYKMRRK